MNSLILCEDKRVLEAFRIVVRRVHVHVSAIHTCQGEVWDIKIIVYILGKSRVQCLCMEAYKIGG